MLRLLDYSNQILGKVLVSRLGTDIVHEAYFLARPMLNKKYKIRILTFCIICFMRNLLMILSIILGLNYIKIGSLS
jgi:hypothetical protein